MALEDEKKTPHVRDMMRSLIEGTFVGTFIRWIGWPIEKIYYDYLDPKNTKTYYELFRENTKPSMLYRLQTHYFAKTGFVQTVWKSFSNFGVISFVENTYPHFTPFQKAAVITLLSTPLDTLLSTPGELNKVKFFYSNNGQGVTAFSIFNKKQVKAPDFRRALSATFGRSLLASIFTYGGIYGAKAIIEPRYHDTMSSANMNVLAALAGATFAQPFIMPGIKFQTHVFRNHGQDYRTLVQTFIQENSPNFARKVTLGTWGRMVHGWCRYGGFFLINGKIVEYRQKQEEEKQNSFKPR